MKFEKSIIVNASPDKVFDYVSDLTKTTEWGSFSTAIRQTSQGPVGVGSTFEADGKQFGKHTDKVVITEYIPGKKFTIETSGDTGEVRNWFALAESGGGTRVTKVLEFIRPAFTTRIAFPMLLVIGPRALTKDLEKIKANIEG
ncbi:MAG: SRPBCC family protein, partial [Actinomycetota bacterium]